MTQQLLRLGALDVTLTDWWKTILTYVLEKDTLCCDMSYTRALFSSRFFCLAGVLFVCVTEFPSVRLGLPVATLLDPCWRIVSEGLLGGHGYTWVMILPESSAWRIFLRWYSVLNTEIVRPSSLVLLPGNFLDPRVLHRSGKERRHHLPPRPKCISIHPKQLTAFPERLELPFPREEILSGFEDIVSSGTDQFTTWVKTDPEANLVQHMVEVQKAVADFREASERRHDTSSQAYRFDKDFLLDHLCKSDSASTTGIQDLDVGRKMPLRSKSQANGIDYVDHDILTNRFHVTHYGGCAILFNKDTFSPNVDVRSVYLHDTRRDLPDQVMEREQGWIIQGVLSRASFRRPPLSGQKTFTVLSLHISNIYAPKRSIAKKLISQSEPS